MEQTKTLKCPRCNQERQFEYAGGSFNINKPNEARVWFDCKSCGRRLEFVVPKNEFFGQDYADIPVSPIKPLIPKPKSSVR